MEQTEPVTHPEPSSPSEQLEAMLVDEGLRSELGSLSRIYKAECAQATPDKLRARRIGTQIGVIESNLKNSDEIGAIVHGYNQAGGKEDLVAAGVALETYVDGKQMSQTGLIGLYNAVAIAHGEQAPVLKHIAELIDKKSAGIKIEPKSTTKEPEPSIEPKRPTHNPESREVPLELPNTFQEARSMKGNSIEDYVRDIPTIESTNFLFNPLHEKMSTDRKKTPEDKKFFTPENMERYESRLLAFRKKLQEGNPYEAQRSVASQQIVWLQLESRAFTEGRVKRGGRDQPDSRIYLNPRHEDMLQIYEEIFEEAQSQGLRFKSKVFDFTLRQSSRGAGHKARLWENYDSVRIDPIVFYGYKDSHDELLRIVNDVYRKHRQSFVGRRIGAAPIKVAPGFSLGSEPTGLSGVESLTSHREGVLSYVLGKCAENPEWGKLSLIDKKKRFCAIFRENASRELKHNIDPENIAFDLEGHSDGRRKAA